MIGLLWYGVFIGLFAFLARTQWTRMDLRRPFFTAVIAAGGAAIYWLAPIVTTETVAQSALVALLVVATITDIGSGFIFDVVSVAAGIVLLTMAAVHGDVPNAASGAVLAFAPLALIFVITRGRGLGFGDVKLGAIIGFGVGSPAALVFVGASFVAGALWSGIALSLGRASLRQRVPFAPFMALGAVLASFWARSGTWLIG
jgi:prepilin signal peptidase PulO-like enzyme (type II secretory pathway)